MQRMPQGGNTVRGTLSLKKTSPLKKLRGIQFYLPYVDPNHRCTRSLAENCRVDYVRATLMWPVQGRKGLVQIERSRNVQIYPYSCPFFEAPDDRDTLYSNRASVFNIRDTRATGVPTENARSLPRRGSTEQRPSRMRFKAIERAISQGEVLLHSTFRMARVGAIFSESNSIIAGAKLVKRRYVCCVALPQHFFALYPQNFGVLL